jgi:hypothetical protein
MGLTPDHKSDAAKPRRPDGPALCSMMDRSLEIIARLSGREGKHDRSLE